MPSSALTAILFRKAMGKDSKTA